MLKRITTHDIEPTDLDVSLAPRLNLLAGDNGLGKTFLLDLAWWALTGTWAQQPAIPKRGEGVEPKIECELEANQSDAKIAGSFDYYMQSWSHSEPLANRQEVDPLTGRPRSRFDIYRQRLVVASRADGEFDILDSYRTSGPNRIPFGVSPWGPSSRFSLDTRAIWDGLVADDGTTLCNGLIRDWVTWQYQKPAVFDLFARVLEKLSPHAEVIKPGAPRRISIEDTRDIPTIVLPYGTVPVTHASAGMRRVLSLAYVLVWTWYEHTEAARLMNVAPLKEMVLLIDEVEAHLHPTWQRVILPALFDVFSEIEKSLHVQVLASTHAPLVLASVETLFDEEKDKLHHFALRDHKIVVEDIGWVKQGDAVNWLVSETFGLAQGRSREAERAIEAAEAFMRGAVTPSELDTRDKIHAELLRVLGGLDDFWPRWLVKTGIVK